MKYQNALKVSDIKRITMVVQEMQFNFKISKADGFKGWDSLVGEFDYILSNLESNYSKELGESGHFALRQHDFLLAQRLIRLVSSAPTVVIGGGRTITRCFYRHLVRPLHH